MPPNDTHIAPGTGTAVGGGGEEMRGMPSVGTGHHNERTT